MLKSDSTFSNIHEYTLPRPPNCYFISPNKRSFAKCDPSVRQCNPTERYSETIICAVILLDTYGLSTLLLGRVKEHTPAHRCHNSEEL